MGKGLMNRRCGRIVPVLTFVVLLAATLAFGPEYREVSGSGQYTYFDGGSAEWAGAPDPGTPKNLWAAAPDPGTPKARVVPSM